MDMGKESGVGKAWARAIQEALAAIRVHDPFARARDVVINTYDRIWALDVHARKPRFVCPWARFVLPPPARVLGLGHAKSLL